MTVGTEEVEETSLSLSLSLKLRLEMEIEIEMIEPFELLELRDELIRPKD